MLPERALDRMALCSQQLYTEALWGGLFAASLVFPVIFLIPGKLSIA